MYSNGREVDYVRYKTFKRMLELFDTVERFCMVIETVDKCPFPLKDDRQSIEDCAGILGIVYEICVTAQSDKVGAGTKAFQMICELVVAVYWKS